MVWYVDSVDYVDRRQCECNDALVYDCNVAVEVRDSSQGYVISRSN